MFRLLALVSCCAAPAAMAEDIFTNPNLGKIGSDDAQAINALAQAIDDAVPRVAKWSVISLGLGLDAAPILVTAFADDKDEVVQASAAAFRDIASSAVPLLRETFKHDSAQVRAATADALAAIGPSAKDAVPELIDALTDADREVRHRAVKTLDVFGSASERAIPALIAVMQNPRDLEPNRQPAIKTVARFGSPKQEHRATHGAGPPPAPSARLVEPGKDRKLHPQRPRCPATATPLTTERTSESRLTD